jgi:hypothetical protein
MREKVLLPLKILKKFLSILVKRMKTRQQDKKVSLTGEARLDDFKWPSGQSNVQIQDMSGRVLFSTILKSPPVIQKKLSEYTICSGAVFLEIGKWTERGMYHVKVKQKYTLGRFPDKYVFLSVNGVLLFTASQYPKIEDEHKNMRREFIANNS